MNTNGAMDPLPKPASTFAAVFAFLASFLLIFSFASSLIYFERHAHTTTGAYTAATLVGAEYRPTSATPDIETKVTPTLITLSEEHARRNREKTTSTAGSSTSTSGDDLNLNHNQRLNDIGASKLRSTSRQTELAERFSNKLSDKIKKKGQANTQTQTSSSSSTTSASASANSTSTAAVPVVTRNVVQVEWVADGPEGCSKVDNTEFWGELVKWGNTNKKDSWEQCCEDCRTHQSEGGKPPCNVWVYCGDEEKCGSEYKHCWLKYDKMSNKWNGPTAIAMGPRVKWTSGGADSARWRTYDRATPTGKKYHVLITASMSIYQQWQSRVFYYWYNKQRRLHPDSDIGGFTRILHSAKDDILSKEMKTVRVDPLPDDGGYVVLSRPFAFQQFIAGGHLDEIEEDYILMAEPDHIFMRPLANFIQDGYHAIGYPFFYIDTSKKEYIPLIRKVLGRPELSANDIKSINGTGSSPVIVYKHDFKRMVNAWHDLTITLHNDAETKKAWGWVLEMWAYTLACYKEGVSQLMYPQFMVQPPYSETGDDAMILHYTYGVDTDLEGTRIMNGTLGLWRFDKRSYYMQSPPRDVLMPPNGTTPLIKQLVESVREAAINTPTWGTHDDQLFGR